MNSRVTTTAKPLAALAVLVALGSAPALAQQAGRPTACVAAAERLPPAAIGGWLADPGSSLATSPVGGLDLRERVTALIVSDARTLGPVLALAPGANARQQAAIGAGLGRAALLCSETQPDYAARIRSGVLDLGIEPLLAAFLPASGDILTGSLAPAAAPATATAGPGLSGQGAAGPSGSGGAAVDEDALATSGGSFSVGGGGGFTRDADDAQSRTRLTPL